MMENEDLPYIEDAQQRKLFYQFTPAAITSNFVPLVVILHDEGAEAIHFEHKMWNVLTPLDNFGYENRGSCWLGEKGDFFVKDLLQELIHQTVEEHECDENHIYIYGSAMGGYGAILHGILCKASAVYVQAPYIRLEDTEKKNFYDFIFAKTVTKENDLSNFLNSSDDFPVFYLCDNGDIVESSREDDMAYFSDACKKEGIKVHLDRCVKTEDDEVQTLKEVLNFLERMISKG